MSPPWETNSSLFSQEFSYILWNQKVHHTFHTNLLLVPILTQVIPVHTLSYYMKIHFNIILPSI